MKNIQKESNQSLLIGVLLLIVVVCCFWFYNTAEENFYNTRNKITKVDSTVLLRTKEVCLEVLDENIADMFVYVHETAKGQKLELHILNISKKEYKIYDIICEGETEMLPYYVQSGKPPAISENSKIYKELSDYMEINAIARMENGKIIIS